MNPATDLCVQIFGPIGCFIGTYNPSTDQCEEFSPATCPAGTLLNGTTDKCALRIVNIDIKPNDSKNTISINNDNSVRVAILGSDTTPINQIDISPLSTDAPKFGGSTPQAPVSTSIVDVNNDGKKDLVLKYNAGKTNPLGFKSGDIQGCINGKLIDGTLIAGCDVVRIIK